MPTFFLLDGVISGWLQANFDLHNTADNFDFLLLTLGFLEFPEKCVLKLWFCFWGWNHFSFLMFTSRWCNECLYLKVHVSGKMWRPIANLWLKAPWRLLIIVPVFTFHFFLCENSIFKNLRTYAFSSFQDRVFVDSLNVINF